MTPAPLVITASSATVPYGAPVPAITPSYAGFVAGDTASSLTTPPTCTTTYTKGAPAGSSFPTSCSGAVDSNYWITYVPGVVNVVPAPLVITASSATVPYLSPAPTITPGYSAFANGDTPASLTTPPICTTTYTQGAPVAGSYTTSCTGATGSNYVITYVPGTVTVTPIPLTITASSSTIPYGSTPTVTPIYTLPAGGTALATPPTCSTTATSASSVGMYPTSCIGAVSSNYSITYVPGMVTITPALTPLTITASSSSYTAGSAPPPVTYTVTGFVGPNTSLTSPPVLAQRRRHVDEPRRASTRRCVPARWTPTTRPSITSMGPTPRRHPSSRSRSQARPRPRRRRQRPRHRQRPTPLSDADAGRRCDEQPYR